MRPGIIAYDMRATQSRLAFHTITLSRGAGGIEVTTPRTSVLPYLNNAVVGRYRFTSSDFVGETGTAFTGLLMLRPTATAAFEVAIDPSNAGFIDVLVTVGGVATNLAVGQGFSLSMVVRDS